MNQPEDKPTVGSIGGRASATAYMLPLDAQEPGALETAAILEELAAEEGAPATRVNGKDRR
jgi:hypothetical protein